MRALVLNFAIAVGWTLLQDDPGPSPFVLGWLVGFGLIALGPRLLQGEAYVRRTLALARFLVSLTWEFLVGSFDVVRVILTQPRDQLHPDYITYDVGDLRPHELILLSFFISLTPGTTTVRVLGDRRQLVVHALDARDPDRVRTWINDHMRRRIVAFTR